MRAHFLGATVHEKAAVPPGQIEIRLVIDGQQRLTTLQLLLKAFQDVALAKGLDSFAQALANLTRNNHPLITKVEERFKVWPTNADRQEFRRVMEAGSPAALKEVCGTKQSAARIGRPLPDAYLYFAGVIDIWLGQSEAEPRVRALYSVLYQELRLVVIDLDDKDDAQLIFETLNARGTPLLAADLVKNALLQEIRAKGGPADDLYQQHWMPFDTDAGYWRKLIGRGHAQRPRIDVFLQHLLTLKTKLRCRLRTFMPPIATSCVTSRTSPRRPRPAWPASNAMPGFTAGSTIPRSNLGSPCSSSGSVSWRSGRPTRSCSS